MPLDNRHKTILVAALDWGLGHAARLTPVIKLLQLEGCRVILASAGNALKFLKQEFPENEFVALPAYEPVYHQHIGMGVSMALQTPKFLKAIYTEHELLKKLVKQYKFDGIISDNRYGMFHQNVPCVLMTHQVFIQTHSSQAFLKPLLKKINFGFINQFDFCWIPDAEGAESLSGDLSHGDIPKQCRYIGLLSRFEKKKLPKQYDVLILLSGPEPQRTVLEQKIIGRLETVRDKKILLVRGVMDEGATEIPAYVTVKNFLSGTELEDALNSSDMVIARSGYSTAMDVIKTERKGVFIPTPGQTEQEYLAAYWEKNNWFYAESQKDFDLTRSLREATNYCAPINIYDDNDLLNKAVREFLDYL